MCSFEMYEIFTLCVMNAIAIIAVIIRVRNPDLTDMRLFMKYRYTWLIMMAAAVACLVPYFIDGLSIMKI